MLKVLRENICPELIQSPESIALAVPTDKNADFQLGLYLYDIQELREYQQQDLIRLRGNKAQYPPKPLNLFFALFINTKSQFMSNMENEQRILGRAMQVLMDHAILYETAEEDEDTTASVTLLPLSYEEKTKIWSVLSVPYQLGIYFSVAPVLLSSRRVRSFRRVVAAESMWRTGVDREECDDSDEDSLCARLVDDYSGKDIRKNSFLFFIGERVVHPIEKENGLYIFLEPQEAVTRIHLEGPDYHACTVQVEKKLLSQEEPVAEVRMYRKPGRGGCEYLEGQLPKEDAPFPRKVCFLREKPTGLTFREMRKIGEEYWFLFQGFTREDLTGKPCHTGEQGEAFFLCHYGEARNQ